MVANLGADCGQWGNVMGAIARQKPQPTKVGFATSRLESPNAVLVVADLLTHQEEFWVLVRGDAHWDNPHCDRGLELEHLQEAKRRKAAIIDIGDLFCAMQGKYDKRSNKSSVRPEHQHGNYLDRLVETAAEYYAPFAHNFVILGQGNHESAILNRHETDLTERLVERLNTLTGSRIVAGGYTGWVRFEFKLSPTHRRTKELWYIHGYGGGGPVTKDMIQASRQMMYVDADILASGHVHDRWSSDYVRIGLTSSGKVLHKDVLYIKCGTYKDEYDDGRGGWHIETGKGPKPVGQWWLRFTKDYRPNNTASSGGVVVERINTVR